MVDLTKDDFEQKDRFSSISTETDALPVRR